MPEQLVYVCALPLYHVFALTVTLLMSLKWGAQVVLIANPRDLPARAGQFGWVCRGLG